MVKVRNSFLKINRSITKDCFEQNRNTPWLGYFQPLHKHSGFNGIPQIIWARKFRDIWKFEWQKKNIYILLYFAVFLLSYVTKVMEQHAKTLINNEYIFVCSLGLNCETAYLIIFKATEFDNMIGICLQ